MELNKQLKNLNLSRKERQYNYWFHKYEEAFDKLKVIPIMEKDEIENNRFCVNQFKIKYPFYLTVISLFDSQIDNEILKSKIVSEIISYLDVLYKDGNILTQKGNYQSISKKVYSVEKDNILKDLRMMLYEAILYNKVQKKIVTERDKRTDKKLDILDKSFRKKPGRKPYSENDLIGLKYHIIQKFYKVENPYSLESRFKSVGDFLQNIAKYENLNRDSFKNSFNKIGREDLLHFCKSSPQLIKQLIASKSFQDYPECSVFISQFDTESN